MCLTRTCVPLQRYLGWGWDLTTTHRLQRGVNPGTPLPGLVRSGYEGKSGGSPSGSRSDRTFSYSRAIPYENVEELLRRRGAPLREKTLWRML